MVNNQKKFYFFLLLQLVSDCLSTQSYASHRGFADDILLIINYNHAWYDSIPFLKKVYGEFFPHIVIYGPKEAPGVELCEHYKGWYSYKAIAHAMKKNQGYKGYLFLHDDCFLN